MPTITLAPGRNGFLRGWNGIVGVSEAWDAVDETPHDGDSSYLRFFTSGSFPQPRASFVVGYGGNLKPNSVTVSVTHKEIGAAQALVSAGISNWGGAVGFPISVASSPGWTTDSVTFTTHPITGDAWKVGDLGVLEPAVQIKKVPIEPSEVQVWITRISMDVDYDEPTYVARRS